MRKGGEAATTACRACCFPLLHVDAGGHTITLERPVEPHARLSTRRLGVCVREGMADGTVRAPFCVLPAVGGFGGLAADACHVVNASGGWRWTGGLRHPVSACGVVVVVLCVRECRATTHT